MMDVACASIMQLRRVHVPCSCGAANCTARWEDTALHAAMEFTEAKEDGKNEKAATTKFF